MIFDISEDLTELTSYDTIELQSLENIITFDFSPESDYIYFCRQSPSYDESYIIRYSLEEQTIDTVIEHYLGEVRRGMNDTMYICRAGDQNMKIVGNADGATESVSDLSVVSEEDWTLTGTLPLQPHKIYPVESEFFARNIGNKRYEITDHLGNVRAVITDIKISDTTGTGTPHSYEADLVVANNYYPFGMLQPGRNYQGDDGYRFGFNGMEADDELKTNKNSYDFGARIYDPRVARWLSVDPEFKRYPQFSPYNFAFNVPTNIIDPDGGIGTDLDGNVIFTPAGKPEWRWTEPPKHTITNPETGDVTLSGTGYYAQKGYVLTNEGKRVEVYLVTAKAVYNATQKVSYKSNGIPVYEPIEKGSQVEGNDATTNCTGTAFVKGTVVLYSNHVTDEFLEQEGYSTITGKPKEGDIGLYYDGTLIRHAEQYEKGGETVTSKNADLPKYTGQPAKGTFSNYDNYKIVRRSEDDIEVEGSENVGSVNNGVRTVSRKEFRQAKRQAKRQEKTIGVPSF